MNKPKVLILGGMANNIPRQLHEYFDVVKQIQQDASRVGQLPMADHIIVIRNWVSHKILNSVRLQYPEHPYIWVNKGWRNMMDELIRRNLIKIEQKAVAEGALDEGMDEEVAPIDTKPDPLEKMSDEELEKLTRPDPVPADDQSLALAWTSKLRAWAETWGDRLNCPTNEIVEYFKERDAHPTLDAVVEAYPMVRERGTLRKMMVGFYRMRAAFQNNPFSKPKSVKRLEEKLPALPPIMSDDVTAMLRNSQTLVDRRNKLLGEIDSLKDQITKIDKDLEVIRPLIQAVENMKRVANQIKANSEKEIAARLVAR